MGLIAAAAAWWPWLKHPRSAAAAIILLLVAWATARRRSLLAEMPAAAPCQGTNRTGVGAVAGADCRGQEAVGSYSTEVASNSTPPPTNNEGPDRMHGQVLLSQTATTDCGSKGSGLGHTDMAETETLRSALQGDGDAAEVVASVLEHGLEVLEAMAASSPRKQRKTVRSVCERVEGVLDCLDGEISLVPVSTCAASEIESLVQCLREVSGLHVGAVEKGGSKTCVEAMEGALSQLARCLNPVLGGHEMLKSAEAEDRMRGLTVLRNLERVVMDEAVGSEVSAVSVVIEMGADGDRSERERTLAWMSAFALSFRNCGSMEVRGQFGEGSTFVRCVGRVLRPRISCACFTKPTNPAYLPIPERPFCD